MTTWNIGDGMVLKMLVLLFKSVHLASMYASEHVCTSKLYIQILSNSLFCQGDFGFGSSEWEKKSSIRVHLASSRPITCRTPGPVFT